MKIQFSLLIVLIWILGNSPAYGEEYKITGIFINLYYHEEGGDLLGEEIFMSYGGNGTYWVSVQCAQGGVRPPFITNAKIQGNEITFEIPDTDRHLCVPGRFIGTILIDRIEGVFTGTDHRVVLKRGSSYWQ